MSEILSQYRRTLNYVWDAVGLEWVAETQPSGGGGGGDATAANQVTEISKLTAIDTKLGGTLSTQDVASQLQGAAHGDYVMAVGGYVFTDTRDLTDNNIEYLTLNPTGQLKVDTTGSLSLTWYYGQKSGTDVLIIPASGKRIRIYYISYNPAADVTCAFYFGEDESHPFLKNDVIGGGIVAKDFGDARFVQGGTDESLNIELSTSVTTNINVFYTQV